MSILKHNYYDIYSLVIEQIKAHPGHSELQHQAVLALARAGSLQFALTEYYRYGLDKIRHHEDIMALGGRLYKDLFLASSGDDAREHALNSSEKYEAAYKDTGGYYSGINAGTMALVAGVPSEIVRGRAQTILDELPVIEDLSNEELYFIEATRAEAYLLLENDTDVEITLRKAIAHDPLNYTSHASTLKQFRMICAHRATSYDWLTQFSPPKSAHYSGHMFSISDEITQGNVMTDVEENNQKINISDSIQRYDIGFGFGALAAGSDILIAETLLDEGCELHVILPVEIDLFVEHSVAPFGTGWVDRFHNCIGKAHSVSIASLTASWPVSGVDKFARSIAMGQAIMQADTLAVEAVQLLLWDGKQDESWTAKVAREWAVCRREQYIIPYSEPRRAERHRELDESGNIIQVVLSNNDGRNTTMFENVYEAALSALDLQRSGNKQSRIGIHMGIVQDNDNIINSALMLSNHALPNSILVSNAVASHLALHCRDLFSTDYIGRVEGLNNGIRVFALTIKGRHKSTI